MNNTILLSVFAENKPGFLAKVTQILADSNVNILWFKIIDAKGDQFGVIRLMVDNSESGMAELKKHGFVVSAVPVLAVLVGNLTEDHPGTLAKLTQTLFEKNIGIRNGSGYSVHGQTVLLIETEELDKAAQVLKEKGYRLLANNEI